VIFYYFPKKIMGIDCTISR